MDVWQLGLALAVLVVVAQAQGTQVPEGLVKPSLTLDYSTLDSMALVCSHSNAQAYGVHYQVTWYRDSNMVGSSFLDSDVNSTSLNVTAQDFSKLQIHKCSLQACYEPLCSGNATEFSPGLDSNTYRPEIKIENTEELHLTEGGMPGVIQISANAPPALFCALDRKSPDCVVVAVTSVVDENAITCPKATGRSIPHLLFPEQIAGSQASLCSVRLTAENWQGVSNISVTANRDMKVDGNRSTTVTITTVIGNYFTYTDTAKSIKVTVSNADKLATCSMIKDHVLTFDRTVFDNPIEGEFIFYQHKGLPYEVRAYSRFCSDVATCLCAVAVRAGDDVVRVSGCRQGEGLNAKLFANGGLESDLKVYQFQGGAKYEVVLPIGGRVVIRQSYMTYLSVWLYPSPLDANNTMGLCGDFDGDMGNDLTTRDGNVVSSSNLYPNQFTVSWRVNRTESLYNGLCPERAKNMVTSVARGTLCACSSIDSPTCQSGRGVLACHMLNQYFPDNEITSSLFERRATPSNCFDAVAPLDQFSYNETVLEPDPDKWPDPWNRNSTLAECVKVLSASRAARLCAEVPGLQVLEQRRLEYCVRDIQMTNDTAWAGQLAVYLEEECLARLDDDLGLAISQEVKDAVAGGLCPMDCSGHGVCENGACVCDDGFVGFGCEVQSSIAPVITRVGGQGLCSVLLDNCTTVTLYGQTFVKSDSLQCRYRALQVNSTGYYYTGPVMTSASTVFVSKSEVRCSLPQTGNYAVAISNNRNNFSVDAIFLSYNPICFRCDAMMGTCKMKNDSCVIGKQCFASMARHPDNHTLVCDPSRSNSEWSPLSHPCLRSNVTHMDEMGYAVAFHNYRTVYNVSSLENCRDLCVQEPNYQCRSVDFRGSAQTCSLSKYRSADVGTYFAPFSADFTYSQWGCENDRCPSSYVQWTTTSGYVTPGKIDVTLSDVLTLELCQERCLANGTCMAIKYNAVRAICILSTANRTDSSSGWIQVPMWSYSEFACKAGSSSERMGPSVSMATLVPTFRLDGQDTYECQFSPLTSGQRLVLYGVLWRVDGAWLEEDTPTNNMTDTFLPASVAAMVKEGTELACAVSACYEDMCEATRGPLAISNTFTASLKIEGGNGTTLREGDAGETIMIYATAPPHVLCRNQSLSNVSACSIIISASVAVGPNEILCPNGNVIPQVSIATFVNDTETRVCQMTFTETSWTTRYRVNVKATTDNKFDGDHERTFSLSAKYVVNGAVEKNVTRRHTQLTVVDVDNGAICMSVNDPHMKTFDGRTYNNYYEGEFILYQHKTMQYSVRTFYRNCNGRASCNCAVAAQAGDDVIIIDKCGPKADIPLGFYPITVRMFRNGLLTPGFKIQSSYEGREYKVTFPSGTTLYAKRSVIRGYNYINVWLVPSASDFNMTEGLCGSFDGNVTNDLLSPDGTLDTTTSKQPNTFSKSWRVTGSDTLYTGKCSDASTNMTAAMEERPSFCYCQENGLEQCAPGNDVFRCSFEDQATDITSRLIQNSLFPTKCAADMSLLDAYPDFQADTTKEPRVYTFVGEGLNENRVKGQCNHNMGTQSVLACDNVAGTDIEFARAACVEDFLITKDPSWSESAIESVKSQCQIQLNRNISLWNPGPPRDILDQLCLAECNYRGACVNGTCQCISGYSGPDCFIELDQNPRLFYFANDGLCDLSSDLCDVVSVFVNNTVNDDTLACLMSPIKVNESGYQVVGSEQEVKADLASLNEIKCSLSSRSSYQIRVRSNNLTSTAAIFIVFDSQCFDCSAANGNCSRKNTGCIINDVCYESGEYNPDNPREFCDPTVNISSWIMTNDFCETLDLMWLHQPDHVLGDVNAVQMAAPGGVDDCRDACVANISCQSFDYHPANNSCAVSSLEKVGANLMPAAGSSYHEWLCKNDPCDGRGTQWQRSPGYALTSRDKSVRGVATLTKCRDLCLRETAFLCRSFYFLRKASQCFLSSTDRQAAISSSHFVKWPGYIFEEWSCSTGNDFPIVSSNPTAKVTADPSGGSEDYTLVCEFSPLAIPNETVEYLVEFLIDTDIMQETNITMVKGDNLVAYMDRRLLKALAYGTELSCGVSACFSDACNETRGAFRQSQPVRTVLEVQGSDMRIVEEGSEGINVSVRSHMPPSFICPTSADCSIVVRGVVPNATDDMFCPNGFPVTQLVVGSDETPEKAFCGHVITAANWQTTVQLRLKAKVDSLYDKDHVCLVEIRYQVAARDGGVSEQDHVRTISVKIVDRDRSATCKSINDPHMTTFDGRYYNNFLEGEFVLYRHRTLPYEVRTFYRSCRGKASCSCAMAVRSDDDVIVLDQCGAVSNPSRNPPFRVKLYKQGVLTPGTSVHRFGGGLKYEVRLPTGAVVLVRVGRGRGPRFLNVWLRAAAADFNQTEGLCGTYDGDSTNDLLQADGTLYVRPGLRPDLFSRSWRVSANATLYTGLCLSSSTTSSMTSSTFCDCQYAEQCGTRLDLQACFESADTKSFSTGFDITAMLETMAQAPEGCQSGSDGSTFQFDSDYESPVVTWPTPSNLTEDAANALCRNFILGSDAGVLCRNISGVKFDDAVASCVADLQLTDDRGWLATALTNVLEQCAAELQRNVTLWQGGRPDSSVLGRLCFNSCSNNGTCTNGVCVCNDGLGGSDCSVDLTQPPTLFPLDNEGLCDLTKSKCDAVLIYGETFVQSLNLTCRMQEIQLTELGYEMVGQGQLVAAQFFSFSQVTCRPSHVGSYLVSLSNNGLNFSSDVIFTAFHPSCHACQGPAICSLTKETCFIENGCYVFGETNPKNDTLVCDPFESYRQWSPKRNVPYISDTPTLSTEYNETTREFEFVCQFDGAWQENVNYTLAFYVDGFSVSTTTREYNATYHLNIANVSADFTYGSTVSCGVMACYSSNCSDTMSPPKFSNNITAEVKISTAGEVEVVEGGDPATIELTCTVPPMYLCRNNTGTCMVNVRAVLPPKDEYRCPGTNDTLYQMVLPVAASAQPGCSFAYTTWPEPLRVSVKATVDFIVDNTVKRDVMLYVTVTSSMGKKFNATLIKEVSVKDRDTSATCASVNDPHLTTFDGRTYDNFLEGEFVLYRHTSGMYEVRSFYKKCNNVASCNVAVAIRSDDDVIIFDYTQPTSRPRFQIRVLKNGDLTPSTRIKRMRSGKTFKVVLPTGATVTVSKRSRGFINVWVEATAYDFGKTEGLCGVYDGEVSNDLTKKDGSVFRGSSKQPTDFSLTWRVTQTDSLYNGICSVSSTSTSAAQYCRCSDTGMATCGQQLDMISCPALSGVPFDKDDNDVTDYYLESAVTPLCSAASVVFTYDVNYRFEVPFWTDVAQWTEETATTYCRSLLLNSTLSARCAQLFAVDFANSLRACVLDIKVSGGLTWALTSMYGMLTQCEVRLRRDVTQWTLNQPNLDDFCPDSCSGHGQCSGGVCICDPGFIGADCSVMADPDPTLLELLALDRCDLKSGGCRSLIVYGGPFVQSRNLTCHFYKAELSGSQFVETGSEESAMALYVSDEYVRCTLPARGSFNISVSNSGRAPGARLFFSVYDSTCVDCNATTCSVKADNCYINGTCYSVGDRNPNDASLACQPLINQTEWSPRQKKSHVLVWTSKTNTKQDVSVSGLHPS